MVGLYIRPNIREIAQTLFLAILGRWTAYLYRSNPVFLKNGVNVILCVLILKKTGRNTTTRHQLRTRSFNFGLFFWWKTFFLWRRFLEGTKILYKIWPSKWFFSTAIFILFESLGMEKSASIRFFQFNKNMFNGKLKIPIFIVISWRCLKHSLLYWYN